MKLLAIMASAGLLAAAQVPPFATPAHQTTLNGTVAGFDGKYHLRLHDDRGYFDDVTLHHGTVITPTGLHLTTGMRVTIRGATDGSTFDADQIDIAEEDQTSTSEENSPGPYTPLFGSNGTPCNTWDCTLYGNCAAGCYNSGYYSNPGYYNYPGIYNYPGYYNYPNYYHGYYYGAPYYVPPVIVVPGQQPTPSPFHRRRPLSVPQQYLPGAASQQLPHTRMIMPAPVYRAPAPPSLPRLSAPHIAIPHGGGPHR